MKMLLLKLSMIVSAVYLVVIYMEWDRTIQLWFRSYDGYVDEYRSKPLASEKRRVVLLFKERDSSDRIPDDTLKSILDQSVRVDSISVQTRDYSKYRHLKSFVTTHVPDTEEISEGESTTIVIPIESGEIYPYDYVERWVKAHERGGRTVREEPDRGMLRASFVDRYMTGRT